MSAQTFARLVENARQRSGSPWWDAKCPAHDDRHDSLSFADDGNNGLMLKCHAGCSRERIAESRGLTLDDFRRANGHAHGATTTRYEIRDPAGALVAVHVRQDRSDGKRFWWERPDGARGLGGCKVAGLPLYRVETLARAPADATVIVTEGEKACDALIARGFLAVATVTGASATPSDESLRPLRACPVALWPDADAPGRGHVDAIARALARMGHRDVRRITWAGARDGDDVHDFFERGGTVEQCRALIAAAEPAITTAPAPDRNGHGSPWAAAQPIAAFLAGDDDDVHYLDPLHSLVRGALTQWFSPRGLGKTHVLHALLVALARAGLRVLLLDRDNPRREIKRRLRAWGASELLDAALFRVMTRDETPPLTDRAAWEQFPFADYDVVALDSLDASAEGVGEQDSAAPSRAIAALLDLAHRADGPAVIVLGNTTKSGQSGRGSGVVEDRADIVYEIRDATDFTPTGRVSWWEELPPAARTDWATRATRRNRRDRYRLAMIASKHRVGPEPEPRVVEIDLSGTPWTWRDVTAELVAAGDQARETDAADRRRELDGAAAVLAAEIVRRAAAGELPLHKRDAEAVLREAGSLTHRAARALLVERHGHDWSLGPDADDARALVVTRDFSRSVSVSPNSAGPHKQRAERASDADTRMDTARPHSTAKNAGIPDMDNTDTTSADSRARAREDTHGAEVEL